MSEREWKLGDVAMLEVGCWANRRVGLRVGDGWRTTDGNVPNDPAIVTARPLVVIDPEDDDNRARLVQVLARWGYVFTSSPGYFDPERDGSCISAALREFADPKPPKPEEPTGLGAVVEDAKGMQWIHVGAQEWRAASFHGMAHREYAALDVTRVLSEGVEAGESE